MDINKKELTEATEYARENLKENLLNPKEEEYIILRADEGYEVFIDPKTNRLKYIRMTAKGWREAGIEPGEMVPGGEMIRYEIRDTHDKDGHHKEGPVVRKLS